MFKKFGISMKKQGPPPPVRGSSLISLNKLTPADNLNYANGNGHHPPRPSSVSDQEWETQTNSSIDSLEGTSNLDVHLPGGRAVKVTTDKKTPMMDLLVQVAKAQGLTPSNYIWEAKTDAARDILRLKPNAPVGCLHTNSLYMVQKTRDPSLNGSNPAKTQPFEKTFRLQVRLPRNQLLVLRVRPQCHLGDILMAACEEKGLDQSKYDLRHSNSPDLVLDFDQTLQEYGLCEVIVAVKGSSLGGSVSDILAMQKQHGGSALDLSNRSNYTASNNKLNSNWGSMSKLNERVSKPSVKKRPAPLPPTSPEAKTSPVAPESTVVPNHSRHSSDSSGYHESSTLSDITAPTSPTGNGGTTVSSVGHTVIQAAEVKTNLTKMNSGSSLSLASKKRKAPPPPPLRVCSVLSSPRASPGTTPTPTDPSPNAMTSLTPEPELRALESNTNSLDGSAPSVGSLDRRTPTPKPRESLLKNSLPRAEKTGTNSDGDTIRNEEDFKNKDLPNDCVGAIIPVTKIELPTRENPSTAFQAETLELTSTEPQCPSPVASEESGCPGIAGSDCADDGNSGHDAETRSEASSSDSGVARTTLDREKNAVNLGPDDSGDIDWIETKAEIESNQRRFSQSSSHNSEDTISRISYQEVEIVPVPVVIAARAEPVVVMDEKDIDYEREMHDSFNDVIAEAEKSLTVAPADEGSENEYGERYLLKRDSTSSAKSEDTIVSSNASSASSNKDLEALSEDHRKLQDEYEKLQRQFLQWQQQLLQNQAVLQRQQVMPTAMSEEALKLLQQQVLQSPTALLQAQDLLALNASAIQTISENQSSTSQQSADPTPVAKSPEPEVKPKVDIKPKAETVSVRSPKPKEEIQDVFPDSKTNSLPRLRDNSNRPRLQRPISVTIGSWNPKSKVDIYGGDDGNVVSVKSRMNSFREENGGELPFKKPIVKVNSAKPIYNEWVSREDGMRSATPDSSEKKTVWERSITPDLVQLRKLSQDDSRKAVADFQRSEPEPKVAELSRLSSEAPRPETKNAELSRPSSEITDYIRNSDSVRRHEPKMSESNRRSEPSSEATDYVRRPEPKIAESHRWSEPSSQAADCVRKHEFAQKSTEPSVKPVIAVPSSGFSKSDPGRVTVVSINSIRGEPEVVGKVKCDSKLVRKLSDLQKTKTLHLGEASGTVPAPGGWNKKQQPAVSINELESVFARFKRAQSDDGDLNGVQENLISRRSSVVEKGSENVLNISVNGASGSSDVRGRPEPKRVVIGSESSTNVRQFWNQAYRANTVSIGAPSRMGNGNYESNDDTNANDSRFERSAPVNRRSRPTLPSSFTAKPTYDSLDEAAPPPPPPPPVLPTPKIKPILNGSSRPATNGYTNIGHRHSISDVDLNRPKVNGFLPPPPPPVMPTNFTMKPKADSSSTLKSKPVANGSSAVMRPSADELISAKMKLATLPLSGGRNWNESGKKLVSPSGDDAPRDQLMSAIKGFNRNQMKKVKREEIFYRR